MIDKKKIEKAASDSLKGKQEELYLHSRGNAYVEGFEDGIKWLLGNLWHDADKKPKKDCEILIEVKDPIMEGKLFYTNFDMGDERECSQFKTAIKEKRIFRWLYLDDLIKQLKKI